jgi:hypothetical protein
MFILKIINIYDSIKSSIAKNKFSTSVKSVSKSLAFIAKKTLNT